MSALEAFHLAQFNLLALLGIAAVVLLVGLAATTRRPDAFAAADRNAGVFMSSMAIAAALLSTVPVTMLSGSIFSLGSDGLFWIVGAGAGVVLMGVLFVPAFRASGATSVAAFMRLRLGSRTAGALAAAVTAACAFAFLAMQFVAIGKVAQDIMGVPARHAVAAAVLVSGLALAAGGARAGKWSAPVLVLSAVAAIVVPLGAWAMAKYGMPVGQLAYGEALDAIAAQEVDMISGELADAASLKPHSRPFLQIDHTNTVALILCIIAGTAALPHVLARTALTSSVATARSATAWALLLAGLVLTALPAYAALAKHEVYSRIAQGLPLADVPEAFARDSVAVHGVRFALFNSVISAMRSGAADADAIAADLTSREPRDAAAWVQLVPEVQDALMAQARGAGESDHAARLAAWRGKILPAAAAAAGNTTGKVTQSAITIEPDDAVFTGLALSGLPPVWTTVLAIGAILAALAAGLAAAWASVPVPPNAVATPVTRIAVLVMTGLAGAAAIYVTADWMRLAAWTVSVLAASVFPVLVMSIWWRRTTAAGAIAGMVVGLFATVGYIATSEMAPQRVDQLNAVLQPVFTPASDDALFASPDGEGDGAGDAFGGGDDNATLPGDGRILGMDNRAAAVFGIPLGFLALILVSLVTRRRQHSGAPASTADAAA